VLFEIILILGRSRFVPVAIMTMMEELLEQATEEIVSWFDNGEKRFAHYRVDGEIVLNRQ